MKKIITLLIAVSVAIQLHAQHDSIAVSQLSELGVLKLIDCSVLQDSYIRLRYGTVKTSK